MRVLLTLVAGLVLLLLAAAGVELAVGRPQPVLTALIALAILVPVGRRIWRAPATRPDGSSPRV